MDFGLIISQLIRFTIINSIFNDFIDNCKGLFNKLVRQHFDPDALRKPFEVFVENYFDIWIKYGTFLVAHQVF